MWISAPPEWHRSSSYVGPRRRSILLFTTEEQGRTKNQGLRQDPRIRSRRSIRIRCHHPPNPESRPRFPTVRSAVRVDVAPPMSMA